MQINRSRAFPVNFWLVILCLVIAGIARSAESSDTIVDRLAKVDLFAFGGVGFAGVISPGEKEYRAVLASPCAETDFEKLLASGNPQAKCYALVGIRQLDPEKFKALSASLRSSKEQVPTMRGCMMSHQAMSDLIERIGAGNYSK